jgi:hypothetical protein
MLRLAHFGGWFSHRGEKRGKLSGSSSGECGVIVGIRIEDLNQLGNRTRRNSNEVDFSINELGNLKRRWERKRERRVGDGGKEEKKRRKTKVKTRVRKKGAVGETGTLSKTEEKTRISSIQDCTISTSQPLSEKLQPPAGCSSQDEGLQCQSEIPTQVRRCVGPIS